jgi:hypothetical protein
MSPMTETLLLETSPTSVPPNLAVPRLAHLVRRHTGLEAWTKCTGGSCASSTRTSASSNDGERSSAQPHPHGTESCRRREHTATDFTWDCARSQEIEHDYVDALKKVRGLVHVPCTCCWELTDGQVGETVVTGKRPRRDTRRRVRSDRTSLCEPVTDSTSYPSRQRLCAGPDVVAGGVCCGPPRCRGRSARSPLDGGRTRQALGPLERVPRRQGESLTSRAGSPFLLTLFLLSL